MPVYSKIAYVKPPRFVQEAAVASLQASFGAAHFEADKSFPLPAALPTFRAIAELARKEPQRPLLIVGHTDATGTPEHALALSEERAQVIAAYLRDDAAAFIKLYEGAKWGLREDQHMLHAMGLYQQQPGGAADAAFQQAVRHLQHAQKLKEDGVMGPATRKALIEVYMSADATTVPASVLIRTLGCGQRHPLEKTQGASEKNQRVDVFAFEKSPIVPAPDECASGKHPGCKVYERWLAAVKSQIKPSAAEAPPAAAKKEPEQPEEMIPAGSAISPPKKSKFIADEHGEVKWFMRLQRITTDDLQPGDILLHKLYGGSGPVVTAQKSFQAEKGSKFTSHAMIFIGKDPKSGKEKQIAHAYEVPMAVGISDPPDTDMIVWRPVKKEHADAAARTAAWLANEGNMKYSLEDCFATAPGDHGWGPKAKERADLIAKHQAPTHRTMCSEFVSYCYQSLPGDPQIKMDAKRVSPMRLEDYLNGHPELFRFAGSIHDSGAPHRDTVSAKKVLESIGGELVENVESLAKKAKARFMKLFK